MNVAAALAAESGGTLAAGTQIVDTAYQVAEHIDELLAIVGSISVIKFTDGGRPGLTVTPAQLANDGAVIALISAASPYLLKQKITATQASSTTLAAGFRSFAVVDTAANIIAKLPDLGNLWKTGQLSAMRLTDGGSPILSLSAAQLAANVGALAIISGSFSIALTDAGTPMITLPSWAAYTSIFVNVVAKITSPFTLTFDGVIRPAIVESIEVGVSAVSATNVAEQPANPIAPFGAATAALLPTGLQVLNYTGALAVDLNALQIAAQAGKLASVTIRDPGVQALSLTPLGATNDALALSKFSPNYYLSQIVTVAQASSTMLAPGFFNFTVQDSTANILADLTSGQSAITALATIGQLARLRFTETAPDIKLSAAQLGQAALGLSYVNDIVQLVLTLTDGGTPTVTIGADLLSVFSVRNNLLSHLTTPYHLVIAGSISAGLAATIVLENTSVLASLQSVSVFDSASNIVGNLGALQTLAAASVLTAVNISNGGLPALALSAAMQAADSQALALITPPYTIAPTYSASELVGVLASLETQAEANTLGTITLTGASPQAISVTPAQLQANMSVFGNIGGAYNITLAGGSTTLSLQAWQITSSNLTALGKITGSYTFTITGTINANAAVNLAASPVLSHLSGSVAVADYDINIGNVLDVLQTLRSLGHLGIVSVQNGISGSVPRTVAQLTTDAGALSALPPVGRSLSVNAAAAAGTVLPASGLTQILVQDNLANILANLAGIQAVSVAGNLRAINPTGSGSYNFSLSAATLSANIGALAQSYGNLSITLNDGGTPTIVVAGGDLNNSQILKLLLLHVASAYHLAVTGTVSAYAASNLANNFPGLLSRLTAPLAVADQSFSVGSNLVGLQVMAGAGGLASITLVDGGVPSLNLTSLQVAAGAAVLGLIVTPHTNSGTTSTPRTESAASFIAAIVTREASAVAGTLGAVTFSDSGSPALALSSITIAADLAALAQITSGFSISPTDSATLALSGWQINSQMLSVLNRISSVFSFSIAGPVSAYNIGNLANFYPGLIPKITGMVTVSDYSNGVGGNLDALQQLAAAGKLGAVTLLDGNGAYLPIANSQVTSDTAALAAIVTPFARSLSVTAAGTFGLSLPAGGFNEATITDTLANVLANLPSIEALARLGQVNRIYLNGPGPYAAILSAATVSASLDVFALMYNSNIALNDGGTPTVTVSGALLAGNGVLPALGRITNTSFNISVSGSVSVSTAASLVNGFAALLPHITTPFTVMDFAANVASNLNTLQTLQSDGLLAGIVLLDGGVPTLNINSSMASGDAAALAKISSPFILSNSYSSLSFVTNLATLETQAEASTLLSVTLTDAGTPVLSMTAAQAVAGLLALSKIGSSHTIALTDGGTPTLVLKPWQITGSLLTELARITSPFTFSISGPLSAFQAPTLTASSLLTKLTGAVSFIDFNNNFSNNQAANLPAIQTLYAGGHNGTIQFLDGGARLQLTTAELAANPTAIAAITSPYLLADVIGAASVKTTAAPFVSGSATFDTLAVQDSVAKVIANLDDLEAAAVNGKLTSIVFTGSLPYALTLSSATVATDMDALQKISGSYSITLTDPGATITLQNTQLGSGVTTVLYAIASPYGLAVNGVIRPNVAASLEGSVANPNTKILLALQPNTLNIRDASQNFKFPSFNSFSTNYNYLPQLLVLQAAGKIGSISLRDQLQTFSLITADATTYAPLLALFSNPYVLSEIITAAQAGSPPVLAAGFTNYTLLDSVANILAALPQIEALAKAGQLGRMQFTDFAPRIVTSAGNIMAGADAWGAEDYSAYPVVLTDPGTPVITLSSYQLNYNMRNFILDTIVGPWTLNISGLADAGTMASIAEENNGVLSHLAGPVVVAGYSFQIEPYVDQLAYLANAGKINAVQLIDGGTPTLNLKQAQLSQDMPLFGSGNTTGILQGPYSLTVVPDITCFAGGTRIAVASGEMAVEDLRFGDPVLTIDGGVRSLQKIRWIGRRRVDLRRHPRPDQAQPIRIRRGAFTAHVPHRDLLLSPEHCVFTDGVLIPVRLLVNGGSILRDTSFPTIEYFHVELDRHTVMLAEGLGAESYLDTGNRSLFETPATPVALHPNFHVDAEHARWDTDACARLAVDPATVEPVWRRLMKRGEELGFVAPARITTTDPDLHLEVDGAILRPLLLQDGCHVFILGRKTGSARLLSRAARPTDGRPWLDDRRQLGVLVERIVIDDGVSRRQIPVDHPTLTQGWWEPERDGTQMRRWTAGAATLDLPIGAGMVEVHLAGEMTYPVEAARRLLAGAVA